MHRRQDGRRGRPSRSAKEEPPIKICRPCPGWNIGRGRASGLARWRLAAVRRIEQIFDRIERDPRALRIANRDGPIPANAAEMDHCAAIAAAGHFG
jgi:hypothetical protein